MKAWGVPLLPLIKINESILDWERSWVVMSTELFWSLDWCWKGLFQYGPSLRCLWVLVRSEEQFFNIFLQGINCQLWNIGYKVVVGLKEKMRLHHGNEVQSPLWSPHAHSWVGVQSSKLGTWSVFWLDDMSHPFPFEHAESAIPQLHLDSHLETQASQGSSGAYLLHGIFGMAWLCSAWWGYSSAGRACFV